MFDLAETRLVQAAKAGDRPAQGELWDRVVDSVWSVAVAVVTKRRAAVVVRSVRHRFSEQLRGLGLLDPWRELVFQLLWAELAIEVELRPLDSILPLEPVEAPKARARTRNAKGRMQQLVMTAPVEVRMVYLFGLVCGCTAAQIAGMCGEDEAVVRKARGAMAFHLIRSLKG